MRIGKLAHTAVISVHPHDQLDKAIMLMEEHNIRHLPVIESNRPVGMISDRDLLLAVGWMLSPQRVNDLRLESCSSPREVREIMSRPALYIDADASIHTAAQVMAKRRFHAMPVLYGERVLGIVTSSDLLKFASREFPNEPALTSHVASFMHCDVHTIGARDTIHDAATKMHESGIRHLPVMSERSLLGILSDRDIRRACGVNMIEDQRAEAEGRFYIGASEVFDVMSRGAITIDHNATARAAFTKLAKHRIGCLPVLDGPRMVGIFTESDALRIIGDMDEAIVDVTKYQQAN